MKAFDTVILGSGYFSLAYAMTMSVTLIIERTHLCDPTFGGTYESVESSSTDTDKIFYGGDKHTETRQTAITEMLAEYGVQLMSGAIILGVYMENPVLRVLWFGKMAEQLIPLLASDNEMLRLNSATALGIMGRQEGLTVLREAVAARSAETFKGFRRSNQYKSAVAICLIGRLGDERDIETLEKIVFDEAEREKAMYAVSISPIVT